MDHVAIMKSSWKLLPKIVNGTKTIESRWYKNRSSPWGKIKKGERIFFKDSGKPVTVIALADNVLSFEKLDDIKIRYLLNKYYKLDGIEQNKVEYYYNLFHDKKYCLLIFLKNAKRIKSFEINKKGFGSMSAWLCVKDINDIKIN